MKTNTINIEKFESKFNENYKFLYDNSDNVAGYKEAVTAFDDFLNTNSDFVKEFVIFRGDAIMSDREAAAFMFTLDDMMW